MPEYFTDDIESSSYFDGEYSGEENSSEKILMKKV